MCVVVCDGLCVRERAFWSVCLKEGEGGTERRSRCQIKTERPPRCRLDTAASPPPPGLLLYCRTGSCSGRSSPPAYPHEETLHCPGNPESPVHIHKRSLSDLLQTAYFILTEHCLVLYSKPLQITNIFFCWVWTKDGGVKQDKLFCFSAVPYHQTTEQTPKNCAIKSNFMTYLSHINWNRPGDRH